MALDLHTPSRNLQEVLQVEESLRLPRFTVSDAWSLGNALRQRLVQASAPTVVSITHANNSQLLFHTVTAPGTAPLNDTWVARKRDAVLRWGMSSYALNVKMNGDEDAFRAKYQLGDGAGRYAIYGGGVPIRVDNVEGIVAVVVVSGLKQEEDHAVVVEALQQLQRDMRGSS